MERKKGIPLVALVIFIALLVAIIITCVIILGINKFGKDNNNASPVALNPTDNTTTQEPVNDPGEEIDNEDIINEDDEIQSAYKLTGNGKTYAKYAIYASGGFSTPDNIKNELKLQLAMAQVTNSDLEQGDSKSIDKTKVEEYAKNVFGDEEAAKIEYKDFSLYDNDTNFTSIYKTVGYVYNANNEKYEVKENDVKEEEKPTQITELITKVVKYNNKIEIFVKPLVARTFYSDDIKANGCQLLPNYDYQTKKFPEDKELIAVAYSDYEKVLKSDYAKDVDGYKFAEVKNNIDLNKIDEYKYTIEKVDDKLQLKSFEAVKTSESEETEDLSKVELTEEEKKALNAELEAYCGDQTEGTEARNLIDKIVEFNSKQQNPNNTLTINLDGVQPTLTDNDINNLNTAISGMKEIIEQDKTYNIRATYQTGVIKVVTITKNP